MNSQMNERLQMAGPKHMEMQRLLGQQPPGPVVVWDNGSPLSLWSANVFEFMAPSSVLDPRSSHRRRLGECHWNTSHGRGVPEEALRCRG